jgi:hypothetical protein
MANGCRGRARWGISEILEIAHEHEVLVSTDGFIDAGDLRGRELRGAVPPGLLQTMAHR